jgi:hypothetical protein
LQQNKALNIKNMDPKYKNLLIVAGITILAVFALWASPYFWSTPTIPVLPAITVSTSSPSTSTAQATLIVFNGTKNIIDVSVPVFGTSTVFSVLQSATASSGVAFAYKDYPGMGYLVTKIGDKMNGTGEAYWQYWINGAYAEKSADQQLVHSGDVIDWKFTASQQ